MIIQTDIRVKDENDRESCIAANNPEELLYIMQQENVEQCRITAEWLGQQAVKDMTVTKADVKKWIAEND